MILAGVFGIFYTGQGVEKDRIISYRGDGGPGWELRKGDPKFDEEIQYGFGGGIIMIGLGIVFILIDDKGKEEE